MSGSGQTMSADAIAALVEAAKEGRLPEEPRNEPRRQRRMRTVDFTRPTKFTADQERRLKRALDTFCRTASGRLSAELRMPLELEVINISQLTWSNAHAQVPSNSIAAMIETSPVPARMLLTTEIGLVLHAIELLLGGDPTAKPRDRRLTDIDWALGRHFIERLLAQLSAVWLDFTELELGLVNLDTHMDTAHVAPVSEPTLSLTMEARLEQSSFTLALLLPWAAIAPVADRFSSRDEFGSAAGEDAESLTRAVGRVDMLVRAEVAAVELPIEQVLALRPGDVLRLDARAEDGVTVFADSVPVHRAQPGRSGSRRAVQISERIQQEGS
jgi:flagellar motor switch protein FliM